MAPKRRLEGKGPADGRKRGREDGEQETALAKVESAEPAEEKEAAAGAIRPHVNRGGGRGLKAVQSSKELSTNARRTDGSTTEAKTKVKEQKLYNAKTNDHVETKVMTEDSRTTRKRDGTVVVSSSTTMKKVCYV
mmetsp:Transcript_108582/g.306113  ORF Transcript_108582/g.306113 Transcript_108582/m.306113 type:complete len:135 (+) Transcript_108582:96-500(+)|eukprot:CAMPEP_0117535574 /NCGR_PEP_ID=MMETSP0784-20121206/41004_1 /TAXON_ID=39447 /ORGANISM="" /LENGTH=134 /DNA_ID=CAMNT_0005332103 /DNA_START=96 /DNA_END=500 /DNA_ORIENTATION=+